MRLALPKQSGRVAPGMSSWVSIVMTDSIGAVSCVPTTALVEQDNKAFVYAYKQSAGKVSQVSVSVQTLHTDGTVEVVGDIKPGDLVVSTGVHHLKDGQKVRLMAPVSKTNIGGLL